MKKILFIIFILIILTVNCKKEEKAFIEKKTFADLTAKILLVHYTNLKNEQKWIVIKDLLEKSGISSQAYLKTKDHYASDPYFWEDTYQKMNLFLSGVEADSILPLLQSP